MLTPLEFNKINTLTAVQLSWDTLIRLVKTCLNYGVSVSDRLVSPDF